jgi:hypothetical protein
MRWSDETFTVTTPSHTLLHNVPANGVQLLNDPTKCSGLDMAPIRFNSQSRSQSPGLILLPSFFDGRHPTISGSMYLDDGDFDTLKTEEERWVAALSEILAGPGYADGTLSWAGGTRTLTVRCEIPIEFSGAYPKTYVYGLVAADPTIA